MIEFMRVPPHAARVMWPLLIYGFNSAADKSGWEVSPQSMISMVIEDKWGLFVALEDGKVIGAVMTEDITTENGTWLNFPFAYSDSEEDMHEGMLDWLEPQAIQSGYIGFKFVSHRPGYSRKARSLGFRKGLTEYRKPFPAQVVVNAAAESLASCQPSQTIEPASPSETIDVSSINSGQTSVESMMSLRPTLVPATE